MTAYELPSLFTSVICVIRHNLKTRSKLEKNNIFMRTS